MGSEIDRLATELSWSLWTELGVPGLDRRHRHVALDPEPLIVVSPTLAADDPRLRDEVFRWCAAHADRISASRLQGILRRATPEVRDGFGALAATLAASARVRWPTAPGDLPWARAPSSKPPDLPIERPSLVRLRVRALAGVGARADVLTELLARARTWTTASDLAFLGYSKRNVARVLAELSDAGVVRQLPDGNALTFQLDQEEPWTELVRAQGVTWTRWDQVLALVVELMGLPALEGRSTAVRRVEAARASDRLKPLAELLRLAAPPAPRGEPDIADRLVGWGEAQLRALASGTSTAFDAPWVRVRA